MPRRDATEALNDEDYQTLAAFRHALKRFIHFSEDAARTAGLTPQQHQALLAIRAAGRAALSVGELAERLLIQPHSASELADRLAGLGLIIRRKNAQDRRGVTLNVTAAGEGLLASLTMAHRDELRRLRPMLSELLVYIG